AVRFPREAWSRAAGALPRSGHGDNAQLLGDERPDVVSDPADVVHQEPAAARRRAVHCLLWRRCPQPGRVDVEAHGRGRITLISRRISPLSRLFASAWFAPALPPHRTDAALFVR